MPLWGVLLLSLAGFASGLYERGGNPQGFSQRDLERDRTECNYKARLENENQFYNQTEHPLSVRPRPKARAITLAPCMQYRVSMRCGIPVSLPRATESSRRMMKNASGLVSNRSDPQRTGKDSGKSELPRGGFRSPRSILGSNGPHEVRFIPPRAFTRCGLAWDKTTRRAGVGRVRSLAFLPILTNHVFTFHAVVLGTASH